MGLCLRLGLGLGLGIRLSLLPVNAEQFRADRCATDKKAVSCQALDQSRRDNWQARDLRQQQQQQENVKMQYKWNYARVCQLLAMWAILSQCCQAGSMQMQLQPQPLEITEENLVNQTQGETELRTLSWLRSAQDMISSPAGHVVVQVAKELIHRSAGNSQVRQRVHPSVKLIAACVGSVCFCRCSA